MIENRTELFLALRKTQTTVNTPISTENIRNSLKNLKNEINIFKLKLARNRLPSFISREKKMMEIKLIKEKIDSRIQESTKEIKSFTFQNKALTKTIQEYFFNQLKKGIIAYKDYEAKDIINYDANEENKNRFFAADALEYLEKNEMYKNSQIKSSFLNLNNSINQLKMVLNSQTSNIDSIDYYFEKSNIYLNQANKEIEKIPGNYTKVKDKIIYFFLYLIFILLSAIIFKEYKIKKARNDKLIKK